MFLITTADERTWRRDGKVLFLGEWCKLFVKEEEWSKLDYEVLPYHWDDFEKLYSDSFYLNDLYEEILIEVSENLNKIHGVSHSVRYWRIIVGLWLLGFVHVLYDRYQSILSAAEYAKVKNTLVIRSDRAKFVPHDFREFGVWATHNDEYNHYLFGRIIEYMKSIPFEYLDSARQDISHIDSVSNARSGSFLFRKMVNKLFQYVPQRFNGIVLVQTGLSVRDIIRLHFSLKQPPYLVNSEEIPAKSRIDLDLRHRIQLRSSDDRFRSLLSSMITEQIPTLYVEEYANMSQMSLEAYPRHPKLILNAVAFYANEQFKFWAGYNVDRNAKLLGSQHGGLSGSGVFSALEDHQIKICDTFYTWGWKSDIHENTKPLAAARLNSIKRSIRPKKGGRFLLVETAFARFSFVPETLCTSASGYLSYLDEQYRFVMALSTQSKKLLVVRLYMHDYEMSQKDRWKGKFPEIEYSQASESSIDQLNKSSLFIGTYNATTYLETFVANFPTVLFWNADHWRIRASAQSSFDGLRKVGVLHDTPEEAAQKVDEISDDPISWWEQPDIQEAKDQYCRQFALTSERWLEEWRSELRNQAETYSAPSLRNGQR